MATSLSCASCCAVRSLITVPWTATDSSALAICGGSDEVAALDSRFLSSSVLLDDGNGGSGASFITEGSEDSAFDAAFELPPGVPGLSCDILSFDERVCILGFACGVISEYSGPPMFSSTFFSLLPSGVVLRRGTDCLAGLSWTFAFFAGTACSDSSTSRFASSCELQQLSRDRKPPLRFGLSSLCGPKAVACFELLLARLPLRLLGFGLPFEPRLPVLLVLGTDCSGIEDDVSVEGFDREEDRFGTLGAPKCCPLVDPGITEVGEPSLPTAIVLEEGSKAALGLFVGAEENCSGKVWAVDVSVPKMNQSVSNWLLHRHRPTVCICFRYDRVSGAVGVS